MYAGLNIALPNSNYHPLTLADGVNPDRVPDFGDVWPTLYVAQDDIRHTQTGLVRLSPDDTTGYYYGDSDPNDLQTFEGLAQHILIWNTTALTAAEISAYVQLTAPNVRKGGDAYGSVFNPAGGQAAANLMESAIDQKQAVESAEGVLGVGVIELQYD